jgi:hypothetical protein
VTADTRHLTPGRSDNDHGPLILTEHAEHERSLFSHVSVPRYVAIEKTVSLIHASCAVTTRSQTAQEENSHRGSSEVHSYPTPPRPYLGLCSSLNVPTLKDRGDISHSNLHRGIICPPILIHSLFAPLIFSIMIAIGTSHNSVNAVVHLLLLLPPPSLVGVLPSVSYLGEETIIVMPSFS